MNALSVQHVLHDRVLVASNLTANIKELAGALGATFSSLEKHQHADVTELLRAHALKLAEVEVKSKALQEALAAVSQTYQGADERERQALDFKTELETTYNDAHAHRPQDTKCTAAWKEWCKETGDEEGFDDDEDLTIAAGGELKNLRCVLTQVSVFELEEPVEDAQEFVYEKRAIVDYIQQAVRVRRACMNPSNQSFPITLAELKDCSNKIRRAEKSRRRQQATQASAPSEEIL